MNRTMRALVVGHSYITGFNQRKLDHIARMGIELALLVPANWKHIDGLFAGQPSPVETPFDSFRVFSGRVLRPGHIASFSFAPGVVARVLREFDPGLVHIEQEVYSFAAAQVSSKASAQGRKVVLFSWENLDRRIHFLQRIARRIAIRNLDGIISGNTAGAALMQTWGFHGRTVVIPQVGVDTSVFAPRPRASGHRFTVGFVGRLVPEKGVATLLEAVALLVPRGIDLDILVCGAGPVRDALQSAAARLGLASRTTWRDSVPHAGVPDVMAQMDALVLPSIRTPAWTEQFGLVLAQAMAMGIPVLGSNSGAIPEVIGRPDAIFPGGDSGALAELLGRLLSDANWRSTLREHGLDRVKALYSKERVAERTVEFWQQIANSHGAPA
jgi:glycosyltransferase involved in cell wall biosynthesis